MFTFFLCLAQQPNSGLGRLIVEVSGSRTIRDTQSVRLLWTDDQFVAEAATYITHNKHNRRTSMSSAGFAPAIPAIKRLQTYALDHTATRIGLLLPYYRNILLYR
jgi:hypothetical protein